MAAWTLMNPPAWRSKDNTRPGVPAPESTRSSITATDQLLDPELQNYQQPPLFLMLERTGPTTVTLTNPVTNTLLYRIRDTGRSPLSLKKKPDFEIFRCTAGDLLVGTIRLGSRGADIKWPLTGRTHDNLDAAITTRGHSLRWKTTHINRQRQDDARWIMEAECVDNLLTLQAAVRLLDGFPNGRVEIWMEEACVDVGGDWGLLDELVTMAYGNMEQNRRRLGVMGPDPSGGGMSGLMMGGAITGGLGGGA